MATPEKVILKVISVKGNCVAKHKEGQEYDLSQDFVLGASGGPGVICPNAFYAIYPLWLVLRQGGKCHWEKDPEKVHIACPDPFNPVMMQLRKKKE
jgi:uncharacterized repeat protein (TIGR04076 family)